MKHFSILEVFGIFAVCGPDFGWITYDLSDDNNDNENNNNGKSKMTLTENVCKNFMIGFAKKSDFVLYKLGYIDPQASQTQVEKVFDLIFEESGPFTRMAEYAYYHYNNNSSGGLEDTLKRKYLNNSSSKDEKKLFRQRIGIAKQYFDCYSRQAKVK